MIADVVMLALFGGVQSGMQPTKQEPIVIVPAKPAFPEFEMRFIDDSIVRATMLEPFVTVNTKYGQLKIPLADIRRIELGFRYPDGLENKLKQATAALASKDFKEREAATKELAAAGEYAMPMIRLALKSTDAEVVKLAEAIQKVIKERIPDDRPELKSYDTIETSEFTFQGVVETPALKAKTKYFAESMLKITELRVVKAVGVETNNAVSIDTAVYGRPNDQTWMETKFEITAGRPLEITASGQIDLWPQQGGGMQYMVGPNGQPQHGQGTPIVFNNMNGGNQVMYFPSGTLIGKIGPTGTPFTIGLNYKPARAAQSGKLYLKVASSPWGNVPSGSYKVNVKAGN